jgi:uncharacterized protein
MTEYIEQEQSNVLTTSDQADARASFLVKTYVHLFGAIAAFTLIEVFLFSSGLAYNIAKAFLSTNWLVILGGFMIVSWIASRTAYRAEKTATQYIGLLLFVLAEALIFVPLLALADYYAPGMIRSAALVTLFGFTGLTFIVVLTRKNFSFLGGLLKWGMVLALVAIVGGVIFGFELGTWFSVAMIGLAGAAILYDTSKIMTVFPTDRHVGAALQLFSSVALMFWYVLRLFLSRR